MTKRIVLIVLGAVLIVIGALAAGTPRVGSADGVGGIVFFLIGVALVILGALARSAPQPRPVPDPAAGP